MRVIKSDSPSETRRIGKELGDALKDGDVVSLYGELGAGKTVFASGIAEALGCTDYITSPTYTIINEYRNLKTDLIHIDAYRLDCPDEIVDAGFFDYLSQPGIIVIEWAERIIKHIPSGSISVAIKKTGPEDDGRTIAITYPEGTESKI